MKALALDYQHRTLDLRDIPEPADMPPTHLCIRVHEVGICGTDRDLSRFKLGFPPAPDPYMVIGHEALGEVVATGASVTKFRKGDWVVPTVRRGCQACAPCLRRRSDLCLTGNYVERGIMGAHGFTCDYVTDDESHFVVVPEAIRDVAILAEPLSVVEKAVDRALEIRQEPASLALVVGAGPIGLLSALSLKRRGLDVTVQSMEERHSVRARLAEDAGARYVQAADGRFDVVIEAAGPAAAAYAAIRRLGPLGVCVLLGASTGSETLSFRDLVIGNQTIVGSVNASPEAFREAVADLAAFDRNVLLRMITRTSVDRYKDSFAAHSADLVKLVHVLH